MLEIMIGSVDCRHYVLALGIRVLACMLRTVLRIVTDSQMAWPDIAISIFVRSFPDRLLCVRKATDVPIKYP